MDAGEGATGDVAGYVAASAGGGESDGIECLKNLWNGFDAEPVELNVLADGEIGDAIAVLGGKIGNGAELMASEESVGDADAHHEVRSGLPFSTGATDDAEAIALGVNAPRAEISAEPFGGYGIVALAGEVANFVEMIPGVFFALETLDALGFGFLGGGHLSQFLSTGNRSSGAKAPRTVDPVVARLKPCPDEPKQEPQAEACATEPKSRGLEDSP